MRRSHNTTAQDESNVSLLPETDESLCARAIADPQAFSELYMRYVDQVFGYCLIRLDDRALAEDCTSQIFTNVIDALPRFRPDKFRSWLFTIAHNVVVDQQRRHPTASLDMADALTPTVPGPEVELERELAANDLRQCLASLSPDQRKVTELRLAGLTGPEISQALGKSSAWVHTTQYRAMKQLRLLLAPAEGKAGVQ